jgi:glutaminase
MHNKAITSLLASYDRMYVDSLEATDIYTYNSVLWVTAKELAVMGATLANHGVNPITKEQMMKREAFAYSGGYVDGGAV